MSRYRKTTVLDTRDIMSILHGARSIFFTKRNNEQVFLKMNDNDLVIGKDGEFSLYLVWREEGEVVEVEKSILAVQNIVYSYDLGAWEVFWK